MPSEECSHSVDDTVLAVAQCPLRVCAVVRRRFSSRCTGSGRCIRREPARRAWSMLRSSGARTDGIQTGNRIRRIGVPWSLNCEIPGRRGDQCPRGGAPPRARILHRTARPGRPDRARGIGEDLVKGAFEGATILRPSVIFGPDDSFFNTLAGMARRTPIPRRRARSTNWAGPGSTPTKHSYDWCSSKSTGEGLWSRSRSSCGTR